jgi:predicted DNA-binding transcriptional regulator YafY
MKQKQLARKIGLIKLLQKDQSATADQLAHAFSVSKRTIFRDLDALRDAGVEVRFDAPRQCYRLGPHFELRLGQLSADEAAILIVAAQVSPLYANKHYWEEIHQATGKLLERLPPGERQRVVRWLDALNVTCDDPVANRHVEDLDDPHPRFVPTPAFARRNRPDPDQILYTLMEAIRNGHDVRLAIHETGRTDCRTRVTPEELILSPAGWTLKGHSTWHRGTHLFPLSRVFQAEVAPHETDEVRHYRSRKRSPPKPAET